MVVWFFFTKRPYFQIWLSVNLKLTVNRVSEQLLELKDTCSTDDVKRPNHKYSKELKFALLRTNVEENIEIIWWNSLRGICAINKYFWAYFELTEKQKWDEAPGRLKGLGII